MREPLAIIVGKVAERESEEANRVTMFAYVIRHEGVKNTRGMPKNTRARPGQAGHSVAGVL